MFNLFRSRQKAVRYILSGLLLLIAVSMVVTLIPGYGTNTSSNRSNDIVLAEVGGHNITAEEAAQAAQRMLGGRLDPTMFETYLPQFLDSMIQQRALTYEFKRLGVTATDDEVLADLMGQFPQFFQNGQFTGKDQFEAALAQNGMTLQDEIDATRNNVILMKIQNLQYEASVVTPKEVDEELSRRFEKAKIKYIAFPPAKFRDQVKPTPEQLKAYFDSHRYQFVDPERRTFQVVVIDQDKVEKSINVTDAQLHAAYSANMDNFRMPERVHVRHILIKTVDKSDAEKKQLLAKAQDVLKQVKSGADFGALAKKYSDDAADKGGDLGWLVRGQALPEFEKVIFTLKPKETSDLVTTSIGYDIAQVLEHEPARVKPFEEARAALADELKKQGLSDKMQNIADQVHAALEKSPGSAADIAKQYGLDIVTVTKALPGDAIPTLGASPEIDGALNTLPKNGVSPILVLPANRNAIAILLDKIPQSEQSYAQAEAKVRDAVVSGPLGLAVQFADKKAAEAATRLRAGEDIDKVARSMNLDVTSSIDFTRNDSVEGLGHAALVQDAFSKPIGTVLGPQDIGGRKVVYKVVDQQHVDPSTLVQERAKVLSDLKQHKGQLDMSLFMDAVMTRLKAEGKVKIHTDVIKQFAASFHQPNR
jgi:peptidyl-prolyl cis-trans isomerase D